MKRRISGLLAAVVLLGGMSACDGGGVSSSPPSAGTSDGSSSAAAVTTPSALPTTTPPSTPTAAPQATDLSAPLPEAPSGAFQQSEVQNNGDVDVEAYLQEVVVDADKVWTDYFLKSGLTEPYVSYAIIGEGDTFQSTCMTQPIMTDHANAYYCPTDTDDTGVQVGALILPATTFAKMWTGDIFGRQSQKAGDFGAATIVAHEFGHHVQHSLMTQKAWPQIYGKNKELIADCFAGNWANSAYYSGYLESGDVEEAVEALFAIGDDGTGPDPHGSPRERQHAFELGYQGGDPSTCVATYWVSV